MGFPILVRCHLYIESGPRRSHTHWHLYNYRCFLLRAIKLIEHNSGIWFDPLGLTCALHNSSKYLQKIQGRWNIKYESLCCSNWDLANPSSYCSLAPSHRYKAPGIAFPASLLASNKNHSKHDDVIKWKHFPRYWPFVREWPVNFPHKGQWRGALMFSLICAWMNGWVNNREAGDSRRHRAHYDVTAMYENTSTDVIICIADGRHTALIHSNLPQPVESAEKRNTILFKCVVPTY